MTDGYRSSAFRPLLTRLFGSETRFIILRYVGAGLGAAKALVFAHVLDVPAFGLVALVLQTAMLLDATALGGITGLMHRYFNDPQAGEESFARFLPACAAWLGAAAVLVLALSALWDVLFWAGLLFALGIGFTLLEPPLRVRGRFGLIALPPILVNTLSILLVAGLAWMLAQPPLWMVLLAIVAAQLGGQLVFLAVTLRRERIGCDAAGRGPVRLWRDYIGYIGAGFPLFFGSLAYMLMTYVDRFFIATFHPAHDLGVHALSSQLGLIALIGLQGWSYVASLRIGAAIKQGADVASIVHSTLAVACGFALLVLAGIVAAAWLLEETLFARYDGLFVTVALGVGGIIAYNAVSSVAALLYFRRQEKMLHRALLAALAANVAIDFGLSLAGFSYLWILACTSLLFIGVAGVALLLVRRSLAVAPVGAPLAAGSGREI